MTEVLKITDENIKLCAEEIKRGGLVAFPTETVYGLGADGLNAEAVKKIYEAKGRQSDNPLILHIASREMIEPLAYYESKYDALLDAFWPGPMTIILKKKDIVPSVITAGLDSVAIRMPSSDVARKLIEYAGTPIAAPSANISGYPSPTCAEHVYKDLHGKLKYILDGEMSEVGIESTVIDLSRDKVRILRPGKISLEDLQKIIPEAEYDEAITDDKEVKKPISPGQKYTHYKPNAKVVIIMGEGEDLIKKMKAEYEENIEKNPVVFTLKEYEDEFHEFNTMDLGSIKEPISISHNIFNLLRTADDKGYGYIILQGYERKGIFMAIMNRIIKSSGHNIKY